MDIIDINGIGPAIAAKLTDAGVTLEQIAGWTDDDINEADEKHNLKGAARRDDWRDQAREMLAKQAKVAKTEAKADPVAAPVVDTPAAPVEAPKPKAKRRKLNPNSEKFAMVLGRHGSAMYQQTIGKDENVYYDHEYNQLDKDGNPIDDAEDEPAIETTPQNLVLMNYLDKKTNVPWPVIREAIKAQFKRDFKKQKDGDMFLHETYRTNR
jgi:hypothetical protein